MKRISKREWLLIFLPCLVLGAYAYYLSLQPKEPRLALDKVTVEPSTSQGYDTDVVMYLYAQGPWPEAITNPQWIKVKPNTKLPYYAFAPQCDLLFKRNGKLETFHWPKGVKSIIYSMPGYSRESRRVVMRCSLNLAAVPSGIKPLQCWMRLNFHDGQRKPHNVPVAAASGSVLLRSTN